MPELPYVPFYVSDWLSDSKLRRLSWEQRGVYIDLLCHSWDEGNVPADLNDCAHMLGIAPPKFKKLWPKLSEFWESDGNGGLINPKMEQVRAKQIAKRNAGSKGGKAGAEGQAK